jgi:hypothetical protein
MLFKLFLDHRSRDDIKGLCKDDVIIYIYIYIYNMFLGIIKLNLVNKLLILVFGEVKNQFEVF